MKSYLAKEREEGEERGKETHQGMLWTGELEGLSASEEIR